MLKYLLNILKKWFCDLFQTIRDFLVSAFDYLPDLPDSAQYVTGQAIVYGKALNIFVPLGLALSLFGIWLALFIAWKMLKFGLAALKVS